MLEALQGADLRVWVGTRLQSSLDTRLVCPPSAHGTSAVSILCEGLPGGMDGEERMLTQVQGFGGDEAAHPHDGGGREARFWYTSSHREAGPFRIRHPCCLPHSQMLSPGTLHFVCRAPSVRRGLCVSRVLLGLPGGRKNGDIVCRASVGKSDPGGGFIFLPRG